MAFPVAYSPEAIDHLDQLEAFIEAASYPETARRYINKVVKFCDSIGNVPYRGQSHDDFRPGVRSIGFERRITIVFEVTQQRVTILGLYYGGKQPPVRVRPF